MLFDHSADTNIDVNREQRWGHLKWIVVVGVLGCLFLYAFSSSILGIMSFQVFLATILVYGGYFYADQTWDFRKVWLWKGLGSTIPLHAAYLALLIFGDRALPDVMTKAVVFIPVVAIFFAVESFVFHRIIAYFKAKSEP